MLNDDMVSVERSQTTRWGMESIGLRQAVANQSLDSAPRMWCVIVILGERLKRHYYAE
ncbi:TPA: hypothetical protein ACRR0B_002054 [Citrobacter werkmanii]